MLLQEPYSMVIQYEKDSHDGASIFRKPTYRVHISGGIASNAPSTLESILDTGVDPKFVNKDLLSRCGKEPIKSIKSPQLQTENCQVVSVKSIVPLFVGVADSCVRAWFATFENLPVDGFLGTSLIDRCIRRIFPTERKVFPWHSMPAAIFKTETVINSIYNHINVLDSYKKASKDIVRDKHHLCPVARLMTLLHHSQSTEFVRCQDAELMTVDTHCIIGPHPCSMNAHGLIEILPARLFYVYISSLRAKPENLKKFMIVTIVSTAPTCTIHEHDDELSSLNTG